jgi:hypothetical protein
MKFRTTIELICEAADKDDAYNVAGEYLRGEIDKGVKMNFHTMTLGKHRVLKYGASCFAALFFFAICFTRGTINEQNNVQTSNGYCSIPVTCTVQPGLKTKDVESFKSEWKEKKEEAILEYIKN